MWRLEQKRNRPLTRLLFPSACKKLVGHETGGGGGGGGVSTQGS